MNNFDLQQLAGVDLNIQYDITLDNATPDVSTARYHLTKFGETIVDLSLDAGLTYAAGKFTISVDKANTVGLFGLYHHTLVFSNAAGDDVPVFIGNVRFLN